MPLPDIINAVFGTSGVAGAIVAYGLYRKTKREGEAAGKVVEANVIARISSTVGDFADDVRLDAQRTIDSIRQDARIQIDAATARANDAEARATRAEARASEAWDAVLAVKRELLDERSNTRRIISSIHSPYASLDGLKAAFPQFPVNGGT